MPTNHPSSAQAYLELYRGKTLVCKASGKLLVGENFETLRNDINVLIRNGVHVIFVFGGQHQIDAEWKKNHKEARPKVDGYGMTTTEVLNDAVLPAYESLRDALVKAFPDITILNPEDVQCTLDDKKGLVGHPQDIALQKNCNTAIGFVGEIEGQRVNVNADDIVETLAKQLSSAINEIIMLTETGGVVHEGKRVPIVLSTDIAKDGTHPTISITDGMKKKLVSIKEMLPSVGKVAMTSAQNLLREIEDWRGGGTLCIDRDALDCGKILPQEEKIFQSVYQEYVEKGIFRPRSPKQLQEVMDHHFILRIKNSPLGGFSLIEREKGWMELSTLWTGYIGGGLGNLLTDHGKKEFEKSESRMLYALGTPKDPSDMEEHQRIIQRFTGFGMTCLGSLKSARREYCNPLPQTLMEYDITKRNPYLFISPNPSFADVKEQCVETSNQSLQVFMSALPKAPRRFEMIDEDTWKGQPSLPYGVVRRMAHEKRKAMGETYMRVLYGEAGRRGDPWGGLGLEVNGELFHFTAGVKRHPELHDGMGNLTVAGEQTLATGLPGHVHQSRDWRWVQDEVDLSSKVSVDATAKIAEYFRGLMKGTTHMPTFQAQTWAHRLGVPINLEYHNCTTVILNQMREQAEILFEQRMPLPATEALQAFVGQQRSKLDDELNFLLHMSEESINILLQKIAVGRQIDWRRFAKGQGVSPDWLRWDTLMHQLT